MSSFSELLDPHRLFFAISASRLFETHPECKDVFFLFRDVEDLERLRSSRELRAHGLRSVCLLPVAQHSCTVRFAVFKAFSPHSSHLFVFSSIAQMEKQTNKQTSIRLASLPAANSTALSLNLSPCEMQYCLARNGVEKHKS